MEHRKFQTLNVNNLWQCETTRKTLIIKLPAFGKLDYIKFLSIGINQVNLKLNFNFVPRSKMEYYKEFNVEIFQFEIQKNHLKCLKYLKWLLDFCVKYQLQAYSAKSQNIFAIRHLHSALVEINFYFIQCGNKVANIKQFLIVLFFYF